MSNESRLDKIEEKFPTAPRSSGGPIDWSWTRKPWLKPFTHFLLAALERAGLIPESGDYAYLGKLSAYELDLYGWFLTECKIRHGLKTGWWGEPEHHDRKRPPIDEAGGYPCGIFLPREGTPVWLDAVPNKYGYIDPKNPSSPPDDDYGAPPKPKIEPVPIEELLEPTERESKPAPTEPMPMGEANILDAIIAKTKWDSVYRQKLFGKDNRPSM